MQEFLFSTCKENKSKFKNFHVYTQCLDDFLGVYLHKNDSSLWKICQILLVLSHGQSSVEHGFSVNKKLWLKILKKYLLYPSALFMTTSLL